MASRTLLPLIKRARAGNVEARLALGRHYLEGGQGVARNVGAAAKWLSEAFAAGSREAGRLLADEIAPETCADRELYRRACRQAAAEGSPRALARLAALAESQGKNAASDWLAAAEGGDIPAACRAGELLLAAGDAPAARGWLTRAAQAGDARAASLLSDLLWRMNDPAAGEWLEKTAQAGDVEAMFRLGLRLAEADDAARRREGAGWLKRAAGLGHGRAMRRLAGMYSGVIEGGGGGRLRADLARAIPLLERAAESGVAEAWWDMARIFDSPRFSGRDPRRARECLERAAREQVPPAMRALGERLAAREKDLTAWLSAGRWLTLALDAGETAATDVLAGISDAAPPPANEDALAAALPSLRAENPALAARLGLAAQFGLSEREALCLDPDRMDQGWCLLADVSGLFRYKPWRLVRIERPAQREALASAVSVFRETAARAADFSGALRSREKRLARLLARQAIDGGLFFR